MSKNAVIISAGGIGKRMGTETPKQFLLVKEKPIILHTIEKFLQFDPQIELVVVLPEDHIPTWEQICQKNLFTHPHKIALGGLERFHSIQNGLKEVTREFVAVHDAVRPLVSVEVIQACFQELSNAEAVVPIADVVESIRQISGSESFAVNRDHYKLVQTPQCFHTALLLEAYQQPYSKLFTDDASVVEALGKQITLVPGNRENVKITSPFDLKLATFLIA